MITPVIRGGSGPNFFFTYYVTLSRKPLQSCFGEKPMFSPKMNFSETGLMCTYLSVLNVKNGPRGAKIKNLEAFLCIFSFHDGLQ
jgi:hypothetical protein